jgi:hypothetical protein
VARRGIDLGDEHGFLPGVERPTGSGGRVWASQWASACWRWRHTSAVVSSQFHGRYDRA